MISGDPRPPEEVLKPQHVAAYKKARADIWHRLIHINTSIQILETVFSYPLHLLSGPFFDLIYWNFLYTCVVMLHALVSDDKGFGLPRLKGHLYKDWLLDDHRQFFRNHFKKADFSKRSELLKTRTENMRHKVIAHRDPAVVNGSLKLTGISITDLRSLYDETETLFATCFLGGSYETSPYWGKDCDARRLQADVAYFMDLLVKNSP